jgi:hypothetical protein
VTHWLLFWAPIWFIFAVVGFVGTWVIGDLARGRNPRWFELTRYTWAGWRGRRQQYWIGYYHAKGDENMARFVSEHGA